MPDRDDLIGRRLAASRERLIGLGRRSREVLIVSAVVGVATGLVVAGFEEVTRDGLLHLVLRQPVWVHAAAPVVGLLLGAAILRAAGGVSPSTSDQYIKGYHQPGRFGPLRDVPVRVVAAIATLGCGAPLGYEGPAMYAGAGTGAWFQRRLGRFAPPDRSTLLVVGAAAGVAAIFKAPVTGLVFALEVPFHDDLARHVLLPAATSSAASYVTFVALVGTEPLLPIAGQPPFNLEDLGGAALVGLACGLLARVFALLVAAAKGFAERHRPALRLLAGGLVLGATVAISEVLASGRLALGPGYDTLDWALDPAHALPLVIAIGTLRVVGVVATVGGGGTGGLFIPLVMQGALIGRVIGGALHMSSPTLLPVVGMAAFLGAGYRVPLAAVVFVAEFTGRPGFVIPGLIAAVVAQLAMGARSVSDHQAPARA